MPIIAERAALSDAARAAIDDGQKMPPGAPRWRHAAPPPPPPRRRARRRQRCAAAATDAPPPHDADDAHAYAEMRRLTDYDTRRRGVLTPDAQRWWRRCFEDAIDYGATYRRQLAAATIAPLRLRHFVAATLLTLRRRRFFAVTEYSQIDDGRRCRCRFRRRCQLHA